MSQSAGDSSPKIIPLNYYDGNLLSLIIYLREAARLKKGAVDSFALTPLHFSKLNAQSS
jgi:hypothetical protein